MFFITRILNSDMFHCKTVEKDEGRKEKKENHAKNGVLNQCLKK